MKTCFAFYFPAIEFFFGMFGIGKNNPEIVNLQFENHVFLPRNKYEDMSQLVWLD